MSRNPSDITLKQVIEVIEGPILISRCQQSDFDCCDDCLCYFHHIFDAAAKDMADRFDKVNFTPKNCNMGRRTMTEHK